MKNTIVFLFVLLIGSNVYSSELTPSEVVTDFADAIIEYDMERFVYHFSEGTIDMFVDMLELLYQIEDNGEEIEKLIGMPIEDFIEKNDREKIVIILESVDQLREEFEGIGDIEIISELIDGDNSTVIILVEDKEEEIPLVLENGEWKIDLTDLL